MKRILSLKTIVVASLASATSSAFAAAPDVSASVTEIEGFTAVVGTLGVAFLGMTIAKKAWRKIGG